MGCQEKKLYVEKARVSMYITGAIKRISVRKENAIVTGLGGPLPAGGSDIFVSPLASQLK